MRMAMLVRSAAALLTSSLVVSCSPEIKDSPTQIMVRVDSSNSQLKASFSDLRVSLARREGDHWEQGSQQTLSSKIIKGRWPIDLPVVPRSAGDEFKQFQVVLDLMKGGTLLAQSRVVTTFVPNERKILDLLIEACPGHDRGFVCAEEDCTGERCEVCNPTDGSCTPVGLTNPKTLATFTDDTIATDRDASIIGRTKDSGVVRDSGAAVDPQADAEIPSDQPDAGQAQGQTCESEGALRCARAGAPQRQICESGAWAEAEPCAESEICDGTDPDAPKCVELSSACKGSAGKAACSGSILQVCSQDGVATGQKDCKSERQCQLGLTRGECAVCVPGVARCTGAKLEVCGEDGLGFSVKETCESASLCNPVAVACTKSACLPGTKTCAGDVLQACNADQTAFEKEKQCEAGLCDNTGKQCDICLAGATKCEGNVVQTCNTDGQSYKMMACSGQTSHCVGAGKCVQCAATADCSAPLNACLAATCNTAAGSCGTTPKPAHETCLTGVCNGNGACVSCVDDTDCNVSGKTHCASGRCVQCASTSQCPQGQECQSNACVTPARCGDGIKNGAEECDPTALGSSPWVCSSTCKKATLYTPCSTSTQCNTGEICFPELRYCTQMCSAPAATTGPASGCPTPPAPAVAMCTALRVCIASGCTSRGQCARGMACFTETDPPYCTGCADDSDCDPGKTCVIPSGAGSSQRGTCG